MKQTYEELERERNELAAQVERLRSRAFAMLMNRTGLDEWYDLEKIYNETPPSALSALKAQWQADGVLKFAGHAMVKYRYDFCGWAKLFANELSQRAQEQGNANTDNKTA